MKNSVETALRVARWISLERQQALPPAGLRELKEWLDADAAHRTLYQQLGNEEYLIAGLKPLLDTDSEPFILRVLGKTAAAAPVTTRIYHRIHFLRTAWFRCAAAVLILIALTATYLYRVNHRRAQLVQTPPPAPVHIAPGGNKAVLTMGNSRPIHLAANKTGIRVDKTIVYEDGERIADAGQLLCLTTPRGGQYQVVLPDGTKVWLNAASSITFSSSFTGNERKVTITGEAYLEVAENKNKPFIAQTGSTRIQVLGTSFNVNAYEDEAGVKITLLNGSVKIAGKVLKPGQALKNGELLTANIEQDVAWKNGLFNFNNTPLKAVMRQVSNWYNVEVVYEKDIPSIMFAGKIKRNLDLSELLDFFMTMGLHYRLEGRRLIITP